MACILVNEQLAFKRFGNVSIQSFKDYLSHFNSECLKDVNREFMWISHGWDITVYNLRRPLNIIIKIRAGLKLFLKIIFFILLFYKNKKIIKKLFG